jgi:hypothetical protein
MRRHALFIGLLIIIAAARFTILLASQTHVHSDEAIIGLMGKHILEGRYFPFYMYGQPYNAGAAWEAYLAAIAFAFFGVGVIALKSCIVVLSLLCFFLFYRMCQMLYDERTALLATIVFALTPSLLKWHFQTRGYSWYFLSIQYSRCRCGYCCLEESCSSWSFRKSFLVGPHSPVTTISFISTRLSKLTNGKRCHFELCHVERRRDISDYSPQTSRDPSLGMTNLLRDDNSE